MNSRSVGSGLAGDSYHRFFSDPPFNTFVGTRSGCARRVGEEEK